MGRGLLPLPRTPTPFLAFGCLVLAPSMKNPGHALFLCCSILCIDQEYQLRHHITGSALQVSSVAAYSLYYSLYSSFVVL